MTLNPRDTFNTVATMYGYDPATVVSVSLDQDEAIIAFRLAHPPGGFIVTEHGFLMTATTRAQLDGMAQQYGYDAGAVLSVKIGRYESRVDYRVTQNDGVTVTVQTDMFSIPSPALVPTIAATDTGVAPA